MLWTKKIIRIFVKIMKTIRKITILKAQYSEQLGYPHHQK